MLLWLHFPLFFTIISYGPANRQTENTGALTVGQKETAGKFDTAFGGDDLGILLRCPKRGHGFYRPFYL